MKMDQTTFGSVPDSCAPSGRGNAAGGQADGQENKAAEHQAAGDDFEPLNRRQQRQHGAKFVELQIVLLRQKHTAATAPRPNAP